MITAAAVAIAIVFLAFGVSIVFFVKQIAIGMAFGVLIDATIVRALLVPSLMRLFGEWNWWAPDAAAPPPPALRLLRGRARASSCQVQRVAGPGRATQESASTLALRAIRSHY